LPGVIVIGPFFQESDMILVGIDAVPIVETSEYGVEGQEGKAKAQEKDLCLTVS
jgi:hypothetical protein